MNLWNIVNLIMNNFKKTRFFSEKNVFFFHPVGDNGSKSPSHGFSRWGNQTAAQKFPRHHLKLRVELGEQ